MHAPSSAYFKGFLAWNDKCFWVSSTGKRCCMGTREDSLLARQAEAVCFQDRGTVLQYWIKIAEQVPVRIIPSPRGCLWLALTQQHSQKVSGSTPAPAQSWPVAKTQMPEGNGCQRADQSFKCPFFSLVVFWFLFFGFFFNNICTDWQNSQYCSTCNTFKKLKWWSFC